MQVSVAKITAETGGNADLEVQPGMWSVTNVPAVNTQATITKAAPGAGQVLVCTFICAKLIADTTAPSAANITLNLINGATGGTSYMLQQLMSVEATASDRDSLTLSGLNLPASANTAITLEFAAATGAHTFQSVTLGGYIMN